MFGIFEGKTNESVQKEVQPGKGRRLLGVVVSDKMKKTVVVAVEHPQFNSKYRKHFTLTTKFKAHDETNQYHVGDKVMIQETRPLSRDKRWIVISKA